MPTRNGDMPCSHCLNRREFVALAAGGAALAATGALTACGDGQVSGVAPRFPNAPGGTGPVSNRETVKVGDFAGLASLNVLVAVRNTIAVKRTGSATFAAYSMVCTHQGCLTSIVSNAFECPCHGSRFNNNGDVTNGPALSRLDTLPTSYDAATDLLTIN